MVFHRHPVFRTLGWKDRKIQSIFKASTLTRHKSIWNFCLTRKTFEKEDTKILYKPGQFHFRTSLWFEHTLNSDLRTATLDVTLAPGALVSLPEVNGPEAHLVQGYTPPLTSRAKQDAVLPLWASESPAVRWGWQPILSTQADFSQERCEV